MLKLVPRANDIDDGCEQAVSGDAVSIPLELVYNPSKLGLQVTEVAILLVLILIWKIDGDDTRVTREMLGQRVNISRATVSRTLCRLAYLGYIRLAHQGRPYKVGEMLRFDEITRKISAVRELETCQGRRATIETVEIV